MEQVSRQPTIIRENASTMKYTWATPAQVGTNDRAAGSAARLAGNGRTERGAWLRRSRLPQSADGLDSELGAQRLATFTEAAPSSSESRRVGFPFARSLGMTPAPFPRTGTSDSPRAPQFRMLISDGIKTHRRLTSASALFGDVFLPDATVCSR